MFANIAAGEERSFAKSQQQKIQITQNKFWVIRLSCYWSLLGSEAFAKPSCLDKKNKNKYQDVILAVIFAKTFLESLNRYKCGSKCLVVAVK